MDLKLFVNNLEEYAKLYTACDWDNVGLLVEPSKNIFVKKVLLTCDLTEPVFEEAIESNIDLIISYHPAISFETPLKKLTQKTWEERSIIKCIENGIAVYSPHTSWDNKDGGINDWIMSVFSTTKVESVEKNNDKDNPCGFSQSIQLNLPTRLNIENLLSFVSKLTSVRYLGKKEIKGFPEHDIEQQIELEFLSSPKGALEFIDLFTDMFGAEFLRTLKISQITKPMMKNVGLGRIGHLKTPIKISDLIDMVKSHLKLKTFRLALAHNKRLDDFVNTVAIGAGCCTGLMNNQNVDFIITGEFLHEEIIHEASRGVSMIITDHTNTERGYLGFFKERLCKILNNENIEINVSKIDRDPLVYT